MLHILAPTSRDLFQPQRAEICPEDGSSSDLMIDIFEEIIYIGGEWHDSSVDREVMLPIVDVISDDL